jgi:hypothetical protein
MQHACVIGETYTKLWLGNLKDRCYFQVLDARYILRWNVRKRDVRVCGLL